MADEIEDPEMAKAKAAKNKTADPAAPAPQDPPAEPPAQNPPPPPPAAAPQVPQVQKSPDVLAAERLQRNGYTDEQIDEALETYGAKEILARRHRLECGAVGDPGKYGDLGADALKP